MSLNTLEERMAEINRRKESIIRMRRQRRSRVLAACVPIVLIVGLCSLVLGRRGPAEQTMPTLDTGGDDAISYSTVPATWVGCVTVQSGKIAKDIQTSEDVTRITGLIERITAGSAVSSIEPWDRTDMIDASVKWGEEIPAEPVTICILDANGRETEYALTEQTLVNKLTGESFAVTEEEYRTLREALNID